MSFGIYGKIAAAGVVAAMVGAAVAVSAASAETAAPAPDSSSTTYQDWTVNCTYPATPPAAKPDDKAAAAKPAPKGPAVCEMSQQATDRRTQQLIARVAIAKQATGDAKVYLQVPAGVLLQPGFTLSVGEKTQIKGAYVRCLGNLCVAEADVKKDVMDQAKTAEKLVVSFTDAIGRPAALQLSGKGIDTAWTALATPAKN